MVPTEEGHLHVDALRPRGGLVPVRRRGGAGTAGPVQKNPAKQPSMNQKPNMLLRISQPVTRGIPALEQSVSSSFDTKVSRGNGAVPIPRVL